MQDIQITEQLVRNECHNRSFHAFGYSVIFAKRAEKFSRSLRLITTSGFVIPGAVGATALGYGFNNPLLSSAIWLAVPLIVFQFIVSLSTSLNKWDDELSYAYEATASYANLHTKYKNLGKFSANDFQLLKTAFDSLEQEFDFRSQQDSKHNIKDWERRLGMRAALREFQKECIGCKQTPKNSKSTDCDVCGQFFYFKNQILNI